MSLIGRHNKLLPNATIVHSEIAFHSKADHPRTGYTCAYMYVTLNSLLQFRQLLKTHLFCWGQRRLMTVAFERLINFHFHYITLHLFMLLWPWLWPDDLDIRIWSRYFEQIPAYQNELSKSMLPKLKHYRQTDKHTNNYWKYYHAAFTGGKNTQHLKNTDYASHWNARANALQIIWTFSYYICNAFCYFISFPITDVRVSGSAKQLLKYCNGSVRVYSLKFSIDIL